MSTTEETRTKLTQAVPNASNDDGSPIAAYIKSTNEITEDANSIKLNLTGSNIISKAQKKTFNYLPIGIRKSSNSAELYQTAQKLNVQYIPMEECILNNIPQLKKTLQTFMDEVDCIYLTIDLDGFSSAYCPGVSAASPIGFQPKFALELLHHIFNSKKVISCDIAEMNPVYDVDQSTALLAANLIKTVCSFVLG